MTQMFEHFIEMRENPSKAEAVEASKHFFLPLMMSCAHTLHYGMVCVMVDRSF